MNIVARPGLGTSPTMFRAFPLWMGQVPDQSTLEARAWAAIAEFDALVSRLGGISSDPARQEILDWIGNEEAPGSPAERYAVVNSDLSAKTAASAISAKRVQDLEDAVLQLRPKVSQAEAAYGTITGAGQNAVSGEAGLTGKGILMGAVAVLGLIILPLSIK